MIRGSGQPVAVLAKLWFAELERRKTEIETELGEPLQWHNPANARNCRIYLRRDADLEVRADWPSHQRWLVQKLEALHRVFSPRAKALPSIEQAGEGTESDGSQS